MIKISNIIKLKVPNPVPDAPARPKSLLIEVNKHYVLWNFGYS